MANGFYLQQYKTFVELGTSTLKAMGIPDSIFITVSGPLVKKDRTFVSAKTLRSWIDSTKYELTNANLVTLGVHARRSQLVFNNVMNGSTIGIISIENLDYDSKRWFVSSEGVKIVIMEIISLVYSFFVY